MSMKNNTGQLLAFLLILSISVPAPPALGSASGGKTDGSAATLINLLGQTCTLHLKNGVQIRGKVWDLDGSALILQLSQSPHDARIERVPLSQIDHIVGAFGKRTSVTVQENVLAGDSSNDKTASDSNRPAPNPKSSVQTEEEGLSELLSVLNAMEQAPAESVGTGTATVPEASHAETSRRSPSQPHRQVQRTDDKPHRSSPEDTFKNSSPGSKGKNINRPGAERPAEIHKRPRNKRRRDLMHKRRRRAYAQLHERLVDVVRARAQTYPFYILLGTMGCMLVLLLGTKFFGLTGPLLGKYLMFPVKLLEMNAHYGVIDQGSNEGVRVGDTVRFYRKSGKRITYSGKVRVIKVSESCSAIELVGRKPHIAFEPGDVGYRDRNRAGLVLRTLRRAVSKCLRAMARLIFYTAENIDQTREQPHVTIVDESKLKDMKRNKSARD